MKPFKLASDYQPAGDQPKAIAGLLEGLSKGERHQTLLGVTGSGKTFTVANVIAEIQKPTLVIAHNKTLAAQLAQEYKEFFPNNAVHYFVSYYDYYQPEAYIPVSDTYIEKEAQINEEIDRLRHATTQSLLTRSDVIVVASVSCIYALGSPEEYKKVHIELAVGKKLSRADLIRQLINLYFERTPADITPGHFRALGNMVEIMPTNERVIYRVNFSGDSVSSIILMDAVTRTIIEEVQSYFVFPAKHYVTPEKERGRAIKDIQFELKEQLKKFDAAGKLIEAERIKRRTVHDLAMIKEIGYCSGIENYSRHFDGRKPGEAPYSLLAYFPHKKDGMPDFLTVIDESHVTVPQIGAMYAGDRARKVNLIDYGFRLPSAVDNRPLTFDEFEENIGQTIYTSATPGDFERKHSSRVVEQIIRPTGLLDPEIEIKGIISSSTYPGQVKDFLEEAEKTVKRGGRVLVTVLTKRMAEDLAEYLKDRKLKAEYLHSDIKTIDRITILTDFRKGVFDCLVGVNLLREGLDLPEVELVSILDADKEGFLRSDTSLIQTIGRAARNSLGKVTLYADHMTKSIEYAISETNRRRAIQIAYNTKHDITPTTIIKAVRDITDQMRSEHQRAVDTLLALDQERYQNDPAALITEKREQMEQAVEQLDFETAALLRDEIYRLEGKEVPKTKGRKGAKGKRR